MGHSEGLYPLSHPPVGAHLQGLLDVPAQRDLVLPLGLGWPCLYRHSVGPRAAAAWGPPRRTRRGWMTASRHLDVMFPTFSANPGLRRLDRPPGVASPLRAHAPSLGWRYARNECAREHGFPQSSSGSNAAVICRSCAALRSLVSANALGNDWHADAKGNRALPPLRQLSSCWRSARLPTRRPRTAR